MSYNLFNFDDPNQINYTQDIENIIKNIILKKGDNTIIEMLNNIDDKSKDNCEWFDNYKESPENYYWLIRENEILGVFNLDLVFVDKDKNVTYFWIYTRCRFNKIKENNPLATSGRLLWCFILKYCNFIKKTHNFVICNKAIKDSIGYHIKMGMKTFNELDLDSKNIDTVLNLVEVHKSYLISKDNPPTDTTILFYKSNPNLNYNNIIDILFSLPPPSIYFSKKYYKKYIKYKIKYIKLKLNKI